jgi:ATP-dependent DNA ligase
VIAKHAAGLYYSGKRTREWLKFKAVHEQEVVIVGYTEPRRSRKYFGSLVLAVRRTCRHRLRRGDAKVALRASTALVAALKMR